MNILWCMHQTLSFSHIACLTRSAALCKKTCMVPGMCRWLISLTTKQENSLRPGSISDRHMTKYNCVQQVNAPSCDCSYMEMGEPDTLVNASQMTRCCLQRRKHRSLVEKLTCEPPPSRWCTTCSIFPTAADAIIVKSGNSSSK